MSERVSPSAAYHAEQRDWPRYYDAVTGKPPRDTLLTALALFDEDARRDKGRAPPAERLAIDLGCGEGRDTAELLRRGWHVLAIDGHPDALDRLLARPDLVEHESRLVTRLAALEEVTLPPCTLLNCSFTLPFCHPDHFASLWARIVESIARGGRFAGQFFGERDTWASLPDRSHQTRAQVEALLTPFDVEFFKEDEEDKADALGYAKHWHAFHAVARKSH
ncbi:MAG: class I SAM-dependent methyltransferase [Phycisphaerales bacterium]|jgi:SAM-dependent methyltransferase|nr:class I SAM-dependent methyltransferase [Phycisphaerales bacterium]